MRRLVLILICLLFTFHPTAAQEVLQLDQLTSGELTQSSPTASYFVALKGGQPVHLEAIVITTGLVLQGALYSGSGALVQNIPNPTNSPSLEADITPSASGIMRLDISSANASLGKFVLVVQETAPPTPGVQLILNEPVTGSIQPSQTISYSLAGAPDSRQILDVSTGDPQASLAVQLLDANNAVIASLETQPTGSELLIPLGQKAYNLTLNNPQDTAVSYQILLTPLDISGPVSTPVPSETTPPTATSLPVATTVTACTVTPRSVAVNVRTGPSTRFSTFASLPYSATITAVARNPEGTWYQVDTGNGLGWVAASVIVSDGPCTSLQVVFIPTPTLPPATYTPMPAPTNAVAQRCAPYNWYEAQDNGAYMTFALPAAAVNTVISYRDGYHTQYVFPTCRAILWTSVTFTCTLYGGGPQWVLSQYASFDWNATCGSNTNTNQPGLSFGVK